MRVSRIYYKNTWHPSTRSKKINYIGTLSANARLKCNYARRIQLRKNTSGQECKRGKIFASIRCRVIRVAQTI